MDDAHPLPTDNTGARTPRRRVHFAWLFASIIVYILLSPWFELIGPLASAGMTLVLIAAAYSALESGNAWTPSVLAAGAIGLTWLKGFYDFSWLALFAYLLYVGVFLFVMVRVFRYVVRSAKVTFNVLMAGVSVYLLLGLAWTMFYLLIWEFVPEAFVGNVTAGSVKAAHAREMLYYSFVTLTTVGYGDITAVLPLARALSVLEVLSGVLYLGILVARLVSMYKIDAEVR